MEKLLIIGRKLAADAAFQRVVARQGCEVLHASTREEALAAARTEDLLCAIVDHDLDDADGIEVLKALRDADPRCELILVTDGAEVTTAIDVLRAGALDYLRRPIDVEQLQTAIGRAWERRPRKHEGTHPVVLVIEDHEPTLRRLVTVLEKEGYVVHAALNGAIGLQIFNENRIDLILCDLRMPEVGGLEVLQETKAKGADVEVIVVTGYGDEEAVVQALRGGAINFLTKPVDIDQMLLAIEKALEFQTTRRSLAYRNRDLELMQLVVRLTHKLELIVEAPLSISPEARQFLHQLVDSLPLGIVVVGADRAVMFANQHAINSLGHTPERLTADWLTTMGNVEVTDDELDSAFARTIEGAPGAVETVKLSEWAFILMTSLRLLRPDGSQRQVMLAVRGERRTKPPAGG